MVGENGGGAFVLVYLLCVILIGIPLLFNELGLGRLTGKNPIGAFQATNKRKIWLIAPILCLILCFIVLSYYSVIAGWTIGYVITTLGGIEVQFEEFIATPKYIIPLLLVFMFLTIFIVQGGVSSGIERASKILMPILLVLVLITIVRSLTLDGAMEGIKYYLIPDFSKITANVIINALGQAFFSMSVGWGLMITYGSYMQKGQSMISGGVWVAFADTLVALLGGLMIFPAVFAFGKSPEQGTTLVFTILPEIFEAMPGGSIIGAGFFVLLCIAALTSSISMLEVPVSYFIDEKKWNRKRAAWIVGGFAFIVGVPSALSKGASGFLSKMSFAGQTGLLDIMDYVFGTLTVVIISLLLSLFVGWAIKTKTVSDELNLGSSYFQNNIVFGISLAQIWVFFIRWVCPISISIMIYWKWLKP